MAELETKSEKVRQRHGRLVSHMLAAASIGIIGMVLVAIADEQAAWCHQGARTGTREAAYLGDDLRANRGIMASRLVQRICIGRLASSRAFSIAVLCQLSSTLRATSH